MKHSIVIHNGTIITMNSDFDIINNGVLCIKNDKLAKIEPLKSDAPLPEGEKIIDARGGII
ncbi:MAG: amidohydrolase, partial [Desulfobacteraceae bacterium]|nr:amidohydrolase [Desulfobacteraceae bacterium]